MPTLHLQNITIKELTDRNSNTYYLIVNNDNQDEAYFCFSGTINYEIIKAIEIEYSEKEQNGQIYRKVTNLQIKDQDELF